jgi:hypothetical protein
VTDLYKLVKTVRRIAGEYSMLERPETKAELLEVADFLDLLIGPDPKVAPKIAAKASPMKADAREALVVAATGPGPPKKYVTDPTMYDSSCTIPVKLCVCGHDMLIHTLENDRDEMGCANCTCGNFRLVKKAVKMTCDPEENERVPMSKSTGVQVILRMEDPDG